jgi:hypothetical protein
MVTSPLTNMIKKVFLLFTHIFIETGEKELENL